MFKELEKQIADKKQEVQSVKSEFESTLKGLNKELTTLQDELRMKYEGIQTDYITIAKQILTIEGVKYYGDGETVKCVEDAVQDILGGFEKLRREYFGCKNYDRWHCQRHDCEYGLGPTHGSITFRVALNKNYRTNPEQITEEQVNACLYYLRSLSKIKNIA